MKQHILILDDNKDFADSVAELLTLEGYRVTVTLTLRDARTLLAQDPADIALLDLRLEETSGTSVIQAFRTEYPDLSTVIITAFASVETTITAMQAGAYAYLRKPIHSAELLNTLDRCFEQRRLARERSQALARLARSEARLRQLIAHLPAAVAFEDSDGHILIRNDRFDELIASDTASRLLAALAAEGMHSQKATTAELDIPDNVGDRHFLITTFPVFDEAMAQSGIGVVATDLTERRHTELRLREAERLEALAHLSSGVAHDFNNLLAVILGNLRLLESELNDSNANLALVHEAIQATLSGRDLTRRLLDIGKAPNHPPSIVDLHAFLPEIANLLRRVLKEDISIKLHVSDDIAGVQVNRHELERALLNLAINSRDAMPAGGRLTLTARNIKAQPPKPEASDKLLAPDCVEILVRDTGKGMSDDVRLHAIDPFFTTKCEGRGTGLGLSSVAAFLKRSGGSLAIMSEPGVGTTVKLHLPAVPGAHVPPSAGITPTGWEPAHHEEVLIVEDEDALRRLLCRQLTKFGYTVREATDWRGARECLLSAVQLDLVLTDLILPGGGTGIDVCRLALNREPAAAAVLITGHQADIALIQDVALPDVPILDKPIEPDKLAAALQSALASRSGINT